jgi:flagellar basal-body rod protein FlgB
MIAGLTNAGAIPVLEKMMQFSGERHRILTHNIANLSTPDFRPVDVNVDAFRAQLGEAIDQRREAHGNQGGELKMKSSQQIKIENGRINLNPQPVGDNILFHDGNDRDLERTMQGLVENFMAFRAASQFIRREFDTLHTAIRERM